MLDVSSRMLDLVRPVVHAQFVCLFLVDRSRQQLWCAVTSSSGHNTTRPSSDGMLFGTGARLSMFKGVLGNVVATGHPLRYSAFAGDTLIDAALEDKLGWVLITFSCSWAGLR